MEKNKQIHAKVNNNKAIFHGKYGKEHASHSGNGRAELGLGILAYVGPLFCLHA